MFCARSVCTVYVLRARARARSLCKLFSLFSLFLDCPSTHSARCLRCRRRRCSGRVRSGKTTIRTPMRNASGCFTSRASCPMVGRQAMDGPQISNKTQRRHSDQTTSLQMVQSGNGCFTRRASCPTIGHQPGSSPQVSSASQQREHLGTTMYQMVRRGNGCSTRQGLCQTIGRQPCRRMCLLPMSTCAHSGQCQEWLAQRALTSQARACRLWVQSCTSSLLLWQSSSCLGKTLLLRTIQMARAWSAFRRSSKSFAQWASRLRLPSSDRSRPRFLLHAVSDTVL
jgi:hypothetical protein